MVCICQSWSDIGHCNQGVPGNKLVHIASAACLPVAETPISNVLDKMRYRSPWTNINLHKSHPPLFADFVGWKKTRTLHFVSPCLVSLSIVDIFKNNVFLSFNLFAKIQRCIRKLRMITKSSERVCSLGAQTNGYESSRWLSPIFPFCFLQSSPPRLIFTNPPPLVLLAIARLGHTQGSIGCQTPHCIPLQPCTPRWPHSKRMAHRGEPQRAAYTQFIISQYHSQGSILLTIVHLNRQLDFQMSKEMFSCSMCMSILVVCCLNVLQC